MARRLPSEEETQFALWTINRCRGQPVNRRVLVAHKDRAVGESISMLLRLKGLETEFAQDRERIGQLLETHMPAVVLMDTRLDQAPDYEFARTLRSGTTAANLLLIAMSNFAPDEPIEALKLAGFDGHFRRPCETWRVIDVLVTFLEYSHLSGR
ncbi:response regulator [Paraburkholderia sp. BCC1884]|uniref:response regulator n=1 Tax=Paraburkholderia sp. BCC1884 TaxID=2562668 RepID=UPI0011827589|nr:response regulator [Paraburkholderia sp. BCC1884]